MKIGIVGAGNIGATLTRRFRAVGHDVAISNSRGPETLQRLAAETGARAGTVAEVLRDREVVIVTIPEKNVPQLPKGLFLGIPAETIVVDTGNYYPRERDGRIEAIERGMPESAWVSEQIGRPVIKAFNNIYAQHLLENGKPRGTPGRIALPVAGDDPRAKAVVMQLVDEIGFDAIDGGTIAESWRQQPASPVYTFDYDAEGVRKALAQAKRERVEQFIGTANSPGSFESPA